MPSSYDTLDSVEPEVCVADCNAVWSLWQDQIGESQLRDPLFLEQGHSFPGK